MKKFLVVITSLLGVFLMAVGLATLLTLGSLVPIGPNGEPLFTAFQYVDFSQNAIPKLLEAQFNPWTLMQYITIGIMVLMVILYVAHFVYYVVKRHALGIFVSLVGILTIFLFYVTMSVIFVPGLNGQVHIGNYTYGVARGIDSWGLINLFVVALQNGQWLALIMFIGPAISIIGLLFVFIGLISDLFIASLNARKAQRTAANDDIVVIHDEDLESPEAAEEANAALKEDGFQERHNVAMPTQPASGIQGPLLIQYINTYAPNPTETREAEHKANAVPVSEIQGAITGEKPLNADDIRKIIKEEMGEGKDQPVIVNVPAAAKEGKGLSAEDVRAIFSEELGRYLTEGVDEEGGESEILVEEDAAPALTAEDIRAIIAAELAKKEPVKEEEKPVDVRDVVREELAAKLDEEAKAKAAKEEAEKAQREALEKARQEALEEAKKASEQPKPLTAEDIRAIIAAELAKKEPEPKPEPKKDDLSIDALRDIIREELRDVAPVKEEKVPPVTVVLKESDIVRPEPKPEPKEDLLPTVNIIVKPAEAKPVVVEKAPEPEPEPEIEPEPVPEPEPEPEVVAVSAPEPEPEPAPAPRAVGEINPDLPPHDKIIRIPFPVRMTSAEKELKDNYNELKAEILSYGAKSRVSNSGDTFRLHKVTFVKITIAGKGLKLYYALDPKDYENSTLPVQDAGHKGVYRDIPLVFKVKSDLSLRRAKQLIADVMEKNGLEQGKIEPHDWASELKDYVNNDEGGDEE